MGSLIATQVVSTTASCGGVLPNYYGSDYPVKIDLTFGFGLRVAVFRQEGNDYPSSNSNHWGRIGVYYNVTSFNHEYHKLGGDFYPGDTYSFPTLSGSVIVSLFKINPTYGNGSPPHEVHVGDEFHFYFQTRVNEIFGIDNSYQSFVNQNFKDALVVFRVNSLASPPPPPPPATCTTPNVSDQALDDAFSADFPSVNTAAKPKYFALQFYNCQNLSKIRYRVNAVGASPDAAQGLLPSSPNTGLAVQVSHAPSGGSYVPVNLGSWRDIITSGNAYSVPMRVEYYRTGNLSPGNVNASMTINIEYQ